MVDRTGRVTSDEQRVMYWMPLNACPSVKISRTVYEGDPPRLTVDFLFVALHTLQFAERADIKEVYLTITTSSSNQITIRAPVARVDCRFMRVSAGSVHLRESS